MASGLRPTTITEQNKLLSLLQISDSLFPTGAFSHSYGLETYVQEGLVTSAETLAEFLAAYLLESAATSDCLAMALAYRYAVNEDWDKIAQLDRMLWAQKIARESREASVKTGIRMLQAVKGLVEDPRLVRLKALVDSGEIYGNHGVVYGVAAGVFGFEIREAALSYVYAMAAGMVNNALRLIPLGQTEGQWVLAHIQGLMTETAGKALGLSLEDLGSSAPALEIRSMQHERLYSRMFMS